MGHVEFDCAVDEMKTPPDRTLKATVQKQPEKLSALQTAEYFVGRAANGSLSRFDEIIARQVGELPIAGDER